MREWKIAAENVFVSVTNEIFKGVRRQIYVVFPTVIHLKKTVYNLIVLPNVFFYGLKL